MAILRSRALSVSGTPFYRRAKTTTTPGTEQTLDTFTVGTDTADRVNLTQTNLSCSFTGKMRVTLNGEEIASRRTSPSVKNVDADWYPARPLEAGDVLAVLFKQRSDSPPVSVEAYVQGTEE